MEDKKFDYVPAIWRFLEKAGNWNICYVNDFLSYNYCNDVHFLDILQRHPWVLKYLVKDRIIHIAKLVYLYHHQNTLDIDYSAQEASELTGLPKEKIISLMDKYHRDFYENWKVA